MKFVFATILCFLQLVKVYGQSEYSGTQLLNKMLHAIDQIKTLRYEFTGKERVDNDYSFTSVKVKYQEKPRKVYLKVIEPNEGAELLWIPAERNGKALVNPNSFPFFSITLHPDNKLLSKNHHYTIADTGFGNIYEIIKHSINKHQFADMIHVSKINWNKAMHYQITIDVPAFKWIDYQVLADENLLTIAQKFKISAFMTLEKNQDIRHYDDVKSGQTIKIPNYYGKKIILYLNDDLIPVYQKIYDDQGLFEEYQFKNMKVNDWISQEEFQSDYEAYGF